MALFYVESFSSSSSNESNFLSDFLDFFVFLVVLPDDESAQSSLSFLLVGFLNIILVSGGGAASSFNFISWSTSEAVKSPSERQTIRGFSSSLSSLSSGSVIRGPSRSSKGSLPANYN